MLPSSGATTVENLKKQFYKTNGEWARHQGKLLPKVAPVYYKVRFLPNAYVRPLFVQHSRVDYGHTYWRGRDATCALFQALRNPRCPLG